MHTSLKRYVSQFAKKFQTGQLKTSLQNIVVDIINAGGDLVPQSSGVTKKAKLFLNHSFSKLDNVINNYKGLALGKNNLIEKLLGQQNNKSKKPTTVKKLKVLKKKPKIAKPRH